VASIVGRTLSHYRVTSAIGAGGMGEVYRATDTTLGREVAIKVLPPEVAGDAERLARFRREAHLLAALNHPNIAAIYGFEEADGTPFLALELVEGEDLKERLARGPIPVDEVIDIAIQVAEALEEAHTKGIVHRDLKPANVKLSTAGKVKVLDFGLAKAWAGDSGGVGSSPPIVSQSPTIVHDGTLAGVVLGTAAYMAPEQARGKGVDRRADVWAFGVLVWEMLTGRILFVGETLTDVIAAVVTREPDLTTLPANTPPALRRLLIRCLRKDPRQRLPDIGAARLELQELKSGTLAEDITANQPAAAAESPSRRAERLAWAAATLVIAGVAGALAFAHLREVESPRPAARFTVEAPAGWDFDVTFTWPAPSPDGKQVVFAARPSGGDAAAASMLWVRPLESLTARPLAGTERGYLPAWSPDGKSLAFVAANEIRRLSLADGTVQRVCAVPASGGEGGIDWNESGTILFSAGANAGQIYSVAATGGEAKPLMTLDKARGEANHHMPQFLPDGHRFLFAVGGEKVAGVYVASLATPTDRRQVVVVWRRSVYASGHLLFVRDGTLLAQPFDPEKAAASGEPVTIASSVVGWAVNAGFAWFAASPAGTLAYFSGTQASTQFQLAWVDRKGTQISKLGEPGAFGQLTLSPDERNVALEVVDAEGQYDLWVMDVARGVMSRVTAAQGSERDPVWAPDSLSLVFSARTDKGVGLRRKGLRVADPESVVIATDGKDEPLPESWLRDGDTLLIVRRDPAKDEQNIQAVSLKVGKAEPLLSGFRLDEPQPSPDGRWLAYVSRESGRDEVYLEPFRRQGTRVRVSPAGGGQPKWRGDGRELFFTTPANHLASVTVRTESDRVDVSLPTELFEIRGLEGTGLDDYAPSADGQRFLVKTPVQQELKPQLQIVTNWTSLLRAQ
jgi:eukaryotic-like serine/threonine-protein kinase